MKRFTLLVCTTLLVALAASAQVPTGTLSGHVSDGQGVLPGVTVTVSSPSLQGTRNAVTTENGDYIFRFLPPGEYRVRFELSGFTTLDQSIKISAGVSSKLDATMPIAQVAEELTVTGSYETISSSATSSATYEGKLVSSLPTNRDVVNYVALSPGITQTGTLNNISIAGAMTFESLYLVNGVAVSENLRGQVNPLYIEDAVEETTTSTSNVSAEYGRFTGGVVNALTKSGGNEIHGSFRDNLTNANWIADTPKTTNKEDNINSTYEATLGGFILRDRLWFFAAGRTASTDVANQTDQPDSSFPVYSFTTTTDETRYEGKLTFAPVPNHRFVGSYISRERKWTNYLLPYWGVYDLASIYDRSIPEDLQALAYTGVLTDNFFVELQGSRRHLTFVGSGSPYTDLVRGTVIFDGATGSAYNSAYFCGVCNKGDEERNNQDILVKGSWFLSSTAVGSHDVRFGYDRYDDMIMSNNYQSGSSYVLNASTVIAHNGQLYPVLLNDNSTYLQYWPIFHITGGNKFRTDSAFINDVWRLNNNFSFNIGVRYDRNDGTDGSGTQVVKDSKISPRLSATWDPKGDGALTFNLGYGKYVAGIANNIADSQTTSGAPAYYNIYYRGPEINANGPEVSTEQALQQMFAWLQSIGGVFANSSLWGPFSPNVPGYQTFIGDNLKSPNVEELTLGVTKRLGTKGLVRADLVSREWHDFYSTRIDMSTGHVTDPNDIVYDKNVVENENKLLSRKYWGVLLQGQYRVSDRLTAGANYTLSRTYGNFDGETSGSGPITSGVRSYPEYLNVKWFAPDGDLSVDQRHRVVMYAAYDLLATKHNQLSVSMIQRYITGTPYGAFSTTTFVADYVQDPGYATAPSVTTYYFTDRDRYRTATIYPTDLAVNYAFKVPAFGRDISLFVEPRVTNVLNQQEVTLPNTTVWTSESKSYLEPFNPFTETPKECPQGASAATCQGMHANWQKGTNFGKATLPAHYQAPRTFTVSFGLRF